MCMYSYIYNSFLINDISIGNKNYKIKVWEVVKSSDFCGMF